MPEVNITMVSGEWVGVRSQLDESLLVCLRGEQMWFYSLSSTVSYLVHLKSVRMVWPSLQASVNVRLITSSSVSDLNSTNIEFYRPLKSLNPYPKCKKATNT